MSICAKCGKTNQPQYKFCLGCGAKLQAPQPIETAKTNPPPDPAVMAAPRAVTSVAVKPAAVVPAAAKPAAVAPVAAAPVAEPTECPKCGKTITSKNAFCGSCGHRLKAAAAPAAVATAVETPAAPIATPVAARAAVAPAPTAPKTMYMTPVSAKTTPRGSLTLIRPDGTDGEMYQLQEGENLIGRGQGTLFDGDPYLSPRHAEFVLTGDGLDVRDLRSLNGVFMRITEEEPLESADIFRMGQELLRFDVISPPTPLEDGTEIVGTPNPGYWGRISVIVGRDVDGLAFPIYEESIVLGRERGDIQFPEDGYVSGTHAQITLREGRVYLSDLGSSNGTFFRLREPRRVPSGSLVLMGQQLFRVQYR